MTLFCFLLSSLLLLFVGFTFHHSSFLGESVVMGGVDGCDEGVGCDEGDDGVGEDNGEEDTSPANIELVKY